MFIQLDNHSIACLPLPLNDKAISLKIIEVSQDKLVMRDSFGKISLKSPWNTSPSDCQFNLIKFKEY